MLWLPYQRSRLALEAQLLEDEFPHFGFHEPTGDTYVGGYQHTSAGSRYYLWLPIPRGYPDQCPPAYVYRPNPLWGYLDLRTINSYGCSHQMHTLSNGPQGEVQICHYRPERWDASITLVKVLLKCVLWLEAYEQHLRTNRSIAAFVRTML